MANTLRQATHGDLTAIIELAREMHDESPRFRRYAFLGYRLRTTLEATLNMGERGCLIVAERDGRIIGAFAGVAVDHFACDVLQACDLGLFVAQDARGGTTAARLVRAYLDWAASIEADDQHQHRRCRGAHRATAGGAWGEAIRYFLDLGDLICALVQQQ